MRVLLAAASMPHLRIFIALTILTRLRPRELLSLKWSNVDLRRRVIEFRDVRGHPTSTRLDSIAQKWFLRAYEASKSDFVIEWGNQQVAEIKKGFQMTAKRAGVICTPMTLYRSAVDLAAKSSPSIVSLTEFENSLNSILAQFPTSSEADTEVIAYVAGPSSQEM
jgi:integrase